MTATPKCPACGAASLDSQMRELYHSQSVKVMYGNRGIFLGDGVPVQARACLACGYVSLFIDVDQAAWKLNARPLQ